MTALDTFSLILLVMLVGLGVSGLFGHDNQDAALDRIERNLDRLLAEQPDEDETP